MNVPPLRRNYSSPRISHYSGLGRPFHDARISLSETGTEQDPTTLISLGRMSTSQTKGTRSKRQCCRHCLELLQDQLWNQARRLGQSRSLCQTNFKLALITANTVYHDEKTNFCSSYRAHCRIWCRSNIWEILKQQLGRQAILRLEPSWVSVE